MRWYAIFALVCAGPLAISASPADVKRMEDELSETIRSRIEPLENSVDWSEAKRQQANDMARGGQLLWAQCIVRRRDALMASKEQVPVVVTAIMAGCTDRQELTRRLYSLSFRGIATPADRQAQADKLIQTAREKFADGLTGYLVEHRM